MNDYHAEALIESTQRLVNAVEEQTKFQRGNTEMITEQLIEIREKLAEQVLHNTPFKPFHE